MNDYDIGQMIDDCEKRSSRLNDWEAGFIDSISVQYARTSSLTQPQKETLDRIWERVTE